MENEPKDKYIYPPESDGELRARLVLHEISIMLGEVRSVGKTKLPIAMFGEKAKEMLGVREESGYVEVNQYERHDTAIWQHDTGEQPGGYGITLIERDRYHNDDPVEPIRLSMELKSSLGHLNISATLPSRHFSDIDWPRSDEEMNPPIVEIDSWQAVNGAGLKEIADKFLAETNPDDVEKFKYLVQILDGCKEVNKAQFGAEGLIYIARYFEKFWRGETIEEMDS